MDLMRIQKSRGSRMRATAASLFAGVVLAACASDGASEASRVNTSMRSPVSVTTDAAALTTDRDSARVIEAVAEQSPGPRALGPASPGEPTPTAAVAGSSLPGTTASVNSTISSLDASTGLSGGTVFGTVDDGVVADAVVVPVDGVGNLAIPAGNVGVGGVAGASPGFFVAPVGVAGAVMPGSVAATSAGATGVAGPAPGITAAPAVGVAGPVDLSVAPIGVAGGALPPTAPSTGVAGTVTGVRPTAPAVSAAAGSLAGTPVSATGSSPAPTSIGVVTGTTVGSATAQLTMGALAAVSGSAGMSEPGTRARMITGGTSDVVSSGTRGRAAKRSRFTIGNATRGRAVRFWRSTTP